MTKRDTEAVVSGGLVAAIVLGAIWWFKRPKEIPTVLPTQVKWTD